MVKPAPGSKLRKEILDAFRPTIEKDLGQKVVFLVDTVRVYGDWTFLQVHPVQPSMAKIDFSKTHYKELLDEGLFDGDMTYGIMKRSAGKWVTKAFVIGPTDVAWMGWSDPPVSAPFKVLPPPIGDK